MVEMMGMRMVALVRMRIVVLVIAGRVSFCWRANCRSDNGLTLMHALAT